MGVASHKMSFSEEEYLAGLRKGDNGIFQHLFNHYYRLLVAVGYKILEDKVLAESIVQDVFVNLWVHRNEANINSLKAYLVVSVRNRSLNEIKRQKVFLKYQKESANSANDVVYQPDTDVIEHIMLVIEELPEQRRKVFKMNRIDGLKYAEIATELNLSVKTIEAQMSKALGYVRERLSSYKSLVTIILVGLFYCWK